MSEQRTLGGFPWNSLGSRAFGSLSPTPGETSRPGLKIKAAGNPSKNETVSVFRELTSGEGDGLSALHPRAIEERIVSDDRRGGQ